MTFHEVMMFYLRKRREFLASGDEYKMRAPVEVEELAKLKLHQQQYVLTECNMHSNPLLLYRILFFVAMQDSRGQIHLLSAFHLHNRIGSMVLLTASLLLQVLIFIVCTRICLNYSEEWPKNSSTVYL